MQGYFLEDLTVGQSETYSRTVTESDVQKFGEVSGDMNPLHFDEEYAKTTLFKGRIAHGMLSAAYISALISGELPGAGSIYLSQSLRFRRPVRIGDAVVTKVSVAEIDERRARVTLTTECTVDGVVVLDGEALVMAPKRGV